jgi:hypothetical protein
MKKLIKNIEFYFDYYLGYFLTNGNKIDRWEKMMQQKYSDKFTKNK